MAPEVIEAWQQAAQQFVDITELQTVIGQRIADLLDVPAAMVAGGAAHALMLGVAASITSRDADFPRQLPGNEPPWEVLRQTSHRDLYDRQVATCGVRIVDVDSAADVAAAVSDRTVMMMAYNLYEPESFIPHAQWLGLAKQYALPTLLDAAADTPPIENLSKYVRMGYDMVAFSGGKAIRGPQDSGLLLGQPRYIELAKQNASPLEGTIGRVAKVSKEDMVALWRAIELFLAEGDSIADRCQEQLELIERTLLVVPAIACQFITPAPANCFPHLCLRWDEQRLGISANELAAALRQGDPPIATGRVHGTGDDGLLISAVNLQMGEEQIVVDRIVAVFESLNSR